MRRFLSHAERVWQLMRIRPKGWTSLLFNTAMAKAGRPGPLMPPVHVTVEPTNACNLRCPVCETGNRSMKRGTGLMTIENFKALVDEIAPYTSVLMFYFMGEPFLNKNAYEMIRYARRTGLYVETCTNGDFVDPKGVIYSDINKISFQIGGMTQQTHGVYRVRGNLERTLVNLQSLIEERKKHPDSNVQIEVGFIVMRHNEHEIPEFLSWAERIGVDVANVIDPCVRTIEEGKLMLPRDRKYWFYDEEAFEKGVLRPKIVPNNECTWIWNSVVINWDGSVVPCCRDPNGQHVFGNAFEQPLREIWNGDAIRAFRRRIAVRQGEMDICRLCSGYGVPSLMPQTSMGFSVQRLSIDSAPLSVRPNEGANKQEEEIGGG